MLGARVGQPKGRDSWGKEGDLGAERGFLGGGCECLVRGQDNREGERVGIKACGVRQGGWSRDREGIFGRRL